MSRSIIQSAAQDILVNAVITATVGPSTSYALTDFAAYLPFWRVKWGVATVTITWTLASPMRGDIFVLPMSNLSTGFVTLTNGAGLSQALTMAAMQANGIPYTTVVDLTIGTPVAATRTSNVWNLVIASNPVNVTLGAAVSIFNPKTQLQTQDFLLGLSRRKRVGALKVQNDHLSDFRLPLETGQRLYDVKIIAQTADADLLEAFYDGNDGDASPGLLWLNPSTNDALYGFWDGEFKRTQKDSQYLDEISTTFTELSKGVKLL